MTTRNRVAICCGVAVVALAVMCGPGYAQVLYGSLTGNVTDPSNAPIPNARVEAVNIGTGSAAKAVTDNRGVYLIPNLQPGAYRVSISAEGFATVVQQPVQLDVNSTRRVEARLTVAQVSNQITVTASATPLQTDRSDVITDVRSTEIENLPLGRNRDYQSLFALVPGASPVYQSNNIGAGAGNPSGAMYAYVNGTSATSYTASVDGTASPYYWLQIVTAYVPPAEAIESVNIATGTFDAEIGQAGGSATNVVTKSGTNTFHGSAWEYNTVNALQARNFFYYDRSIPKDVRNQFGVTLGGPIKKDSLFFFADWERYLIRKNGSGLKSVPTAQMRVGDFSDVSTAIYDPLTGNANGSGRTRFPNNQVPLDRISYAAAKLGPMIPLPNLQTAGYANNYFSSTNFVTTRDNVDAKVNYNSAPGTSFFARYSASPTYIFDPPALGDAMGQPNLTGHPGKGLGLTQTAGIGATHTFTPRLLFDGNVGFTRQRIAGENIDIGKNYGLDVLKIPGTNGPSRLQGGVPSFVITGLTSLGTTTANNPFYYRDNQFNYAANLSWIKGAHSFRFGASVGRYQLNHTQPQGNSGARGRFTFTGGLTAIAGGPSPNAYNAWADLLLGLPQTMGKDYQYFDPGTGRFITYAFYARDQWQITRKLSVSYGIRYEQYPFPTQAHSGGLNYDPETNLSYIGGVNGVPSNAYVDVGLGQLGPRLGLAYRLDSQTVIRGGLGFSTDPSSFAYMILIYPAVLTQGINGANSYSAAGSLATGLPAFPGPDVSQGSVPLPTYLGTYSFPRQFDRGYVRSQSFTVQRQLPGRINAQVAYVGTSSVRPIAFRNVNAAAPGGGNAGLPYYQKWGNSNTIRMIGPLGSGSYNSLQTKITRQAGTTLLGVVYTYSKALNYVDSATDSLAWSWAQALDRNYALANYDRTHNFRFYGVYALPFGPGQRWANRGIGGAVFGGWKVSPMMSQLSGTPFTVSSSATSLNAPGNNQTADQVKPQVAIFGGHGPGKPYFDPNAFAPVTGVRFGTSGRNILQGPGMFNVDVSVVRQFSVKEKVRLEFRAESFSLTNTPQFSNPAANVSNATFVNGQVTNYNGYSIITAASGERQIRFAARVSF